ncbi:WD40 repeat domain-containing protein [Actinoplanes utahensis]|uniref:WD40 repeat domain-containing protein n=1 Tax=Actinoplanes utahensis TaxID=1869 RepID=A0A0A6UMM0_ACTUT|nr:hypothetical protein [Actinoplanes utahensis]KHD77365.1 hypothetical protein MB27_11440 [Actinoplanes utahensis]GIF32888.1 hypothetical protein Aut01nite_58740 [Actinoplanes utahensis]
MVAEGPPAQPVSRGRRLLLILLTVAAVFCGAGTIVVGATTDWFGLTGGLEKDPCGQPLGVVPAEFGGKDHPVVASPDGRFVVDVHAMTLFDVGTGRKVRTFDMNRMTTSPVFTPNGKLMVSYGEVQAETFAGTVNAAVVWNVDTGKTVRTWPVPNDLGVAGRKNGIRILQAVAISPDGRYVATGSEDLVRIRDLRTGRHVKDIQERFGFSIGYDGDSRLLFDADGTRLAATGEGGKVLIFRTEDWRPEAEPYIPGGGVRTLAFSPDGKYLAAVSNDRRSRVVELGTNRSVVVEYAMPMMRSVAFSPDSASLLSLSNWGVAVRSEPLTGRVLAVADSCEYAGTPLHLPGAKTFLTVEPGRFVKVAVP